MFTPIENVNYMVIHGSHDGDVSSFNGLRAFQRIRVHRRQAVVQGGVVRLPREPRPVEHRVGQQGQRSAQRTLARPARPDHAGGAAAVQQGDDRRVHGSDAARQDGVPADVPRSSRRGRVAAEDDVHHALSGESGFTPLATFDEDVDVTTGSVPGVTISGDSLGDVEGEPAQSPQRRERSDQHQRVTLGWNNHIRGDDTTKLGKPASYTIAMSDSLRSALARGSRDRRSICRSRRRTRSPARARRRATRRRRPTARRRTTRSRRAKKPTPRTRQGLDAGRSHGRAGRRGGTRRATAAQQVRRAAPPARDSHSAAARRGAAALSRRSTRWCCRRT